MLPALLVILLALRTLRIRRCLDGDALDMTAVKEIRPLLAFAWVMTVAVALGVVLALLVFDYLAGGAPTGSAILGALPPFLCAVVANTSYGAAKGWLNPESQSKGKNFRSSSSGS